MFKPLQAASLLQTVYARWDDFSIRLPFNGTASGLNATPYR